MLVLRPQESVGDPLAVIEVLSAGRLIQNQQRRVAGPCLNPGLHEGLRQRYPLRLTDRECSRCSRPTVRRYPQSGQFLRRMLSGHSPGISATPETGAHRVKNQPVRIQAVPRFLQYSPHDTSDLLAGSVGPRLQALPAPRHLTCPWAWQAQRQPQEARLTGTGGSGDAKRLPDAKTEATALALC